MMLIIKVGSEDDKGDEFDEFDRKVKGKSSEQVLIIILFIISLLY